MEGTAAPAAPAPPMSADQAQAERSTLMGDAAFRTAAMNPTSAEWARLAGLDRTIAEARSANEERRAAEAEGARQQAEAARAAAGLPAPPPDDPETIPDGIFDPPESPGRYRVPDAAARGLKTDAATEFEIMKGLHQAGADQDLVHAAYAVSMDAIAKAQARKAAGLPPDLAALDAQGRATQARLMKEWGPQYAARLDATHAEATRLWEALPESVRGASLADFMAVTGLQGNAPFIVALELRARARAQRKEKQ